uniref:Retinol dehydrogenase 10 n=1 Tax=Aceria tosichella TaxID=561515 RepID=A0A6G1S4R8_9ACAR
MDQFEPVFRFLKYMPAIIWATLVSLVQWFIPYSWYAKDVSDEIVLITGAGSGLGRQIALEYAKLNASLVLWDINEAGLRETKKMVEKEQRRLESTTKKKKEETSNNYKRICLAYNVDVGNREAVYESAKQVRKDLESMEGASKKYVSILVNNAGIYHGLMLHELKDHQIERIFRINILAHFWTVRAFLPEMIKQEHGHIVEIASMGGLSGMMKQVDYCATKFATIGFEESLSIELTAMGLEDKIHTTAICPLFFQSNLFTGFDSKATAIMTTDYVASQAVLGMRCNHSRVLLPPKAYLLNLIKPITPRKGAFLWAKILNLMEGIRDVKGAAAN